MCLAVYFPLRARVPDAHGPGTSYLATTPDGHATSDNDRLPSNPTHRRAVHQEPDSERQGQEREPEQLLAAAEVLLVWVPGR